MALQESMLKQKSQIKWFEEGDKHTKYFHSILREKRRRQQVNRIKNSRGKWIKGDDKIANRAVRHFQNFFNLTPPTINNSILNCIPFCILGDDNSMLSMVPGEVEIKEAVFSLSPHSTAGPDGFNGTFFQSCWNIIERDVTALVKEFFKGKGLKQGDPLFPTLLIIAVEVLSRSLNSLYRNPNFIPFSMPLNVPKINHLAYPDGIIIFCSGSSNSIKLVMNVIDNYERSSGQMVNRDKSYFLTAPNTTATRINGIRKCSGFMDKNFLFTYLGCPLYVDRKKIVFFDNMISKIVKRLNG
ncbi:uncharacterized protein [Nicotiana sylvestris]|uniref:uncharacterized protein n=1 Tax=Nicotiana sylvestris TaxID=4096 RepID=UPI00388C60AD